MRERKKKAGGKIHYDVCRLSGREAVKTVTAGAGLGIFTAWICYHSLLALPVAGLIAWWYVNARKKQMVIRRKNLLNYHFRDFLAALHTAMLAGYSLENGVKAAASDLEKLYGSEDALVVELKNIVREMNYQIPVEKLFCDLGSRSGVEDIRTFSEVIMVAKRTGGNMGQVLQNTWQTLGGKIDTRQEIDTMLASRRYEQKIMSLMPAGIILYLSVSFDGFMDVLYGNAVGAAIMTGCLVVYLSALWISRKMMDIRV